MTSSTSALKACPEASANFLSRLTFWWANSLFITGYRKTLTEDDIWEVTAEQTAENVSQKLELNWQREFAGVCPERWAQMSAEDDNKDEKVGTSDNWKEDARLLFSVWKVLMHSFGWLYFIETFFLLCSTLLSFVHPQLLKLFFAFISSSTVSDKNQASTEPDLSTGYLLATLFFLTSMLELFISEGQSRASNTSSHATQNAFASLIYSKSLSLDCATRLKTTSGDLISLLNGDSTEMSDVVATVNRLWMTPLQIVLALYFIFLEVGGAADLVAVGIIAATIPLNLWIRRKQKESKKRLHTKRKERVKLTTELISGIRLLKYFAWEVPFASKIHAVREEELAEIAINNGLNQLLDFIWSVAPFAVSLATFSVYLLLGADQSSLTAGKVFVSLSLFNLLRAPIRSLPQLWNSLAKLAISVKKVTVFLNSEMKSYVKLEEEGDDAVRFEGATLAWEKNVENGPKKEPILKDINLRIQKGSLVALVGSVGAGKSSILSALLGDMELLSGSVFVSKNKSSKSIGYVAQQAWIQNATIKDNILFGSEFEKEKYQKVLEDCALIEDLNQLPAGDETEIGEKGINLSGGQKQRVALARACYASSASLFCLDDPLAAVDSHVAGHIFKRVISSNGGLLSGKTRILVTSNVAILPEVDQIVLLDGGRISCTGSYQELLEKSISFAELVKKSNLSRGKVVSGNVGDNRDESEDEDEKTFKEKPTKEKSDKKDSDGKLIEEEKDKSKSRVPLSVYRRYFRSLTYSAMLFCGFLFAADHFCETGSKIWLALWSSENGRNSEDSDSKGGLSAYGVLGLLAATFYGLGSFSLVRSGLKSASTIHRALLDHLTHLPMVHFEQTPIGRTINLISGNLYSLDYSLPMLIRGIFMCSLSVLTNLFLISQQMPGFLAIFFPVLAFYYLFESFHKVTDRQLDQMFYRSYSPVYSHFHESYAGRTTIRAFGAEDRFINECHQKLDRKWRFSFVSYVSNTWMHMRKELLTQLLALGVKLMIVSNLGGDNVSKSKLATEVGYVGLLLSQSTSLSTAHYIVALFSYLDHSMASVERIDECCQKETEAKWELDEEDGESVSKKLDEEWPSRGAISFVDYSVRYREGLELVLKNVNLKIVPGERVGVVGRTGAGKSTLTLALFRILEPSSGQIFIDDVDITTVGLHRLRRGLAIIPQDPTLFSGSIRSNLDPFGVASDSRLMEVLGQCHLKSVVDALPLGLDAEVSENGANFSVGQRQLLCLGRALLRGARILVLDEATAAIDLETDALIQATIRQEFAHCTVLCIAHRLDTILDAHRVAVMEAGRVLEFAPPKDLLTDRKSAFYALARDANIV